MKNEIRLIGGKWRGRKIQFPDSPGLRPTSDRLRQTLFNWLQFEIPGSICLDAFAGSGALGFEALSRGAQSVIMLENQKQNVDQLIKTASTFKAENLSIQTIDAIYFLKTTDIQFDFIFLDPPFSKAIWLEALDLIKERNLLRKNGKVYLEIKNTPENSDIDKQDWFSYQILKKFQSSQVLAYLMT